MRTPTRYILVVALGLFATVYVSWSFFETEPEPPLPPLLQRVSAGGGYACPSASETEAGFRQISRPAAELDQRLSDGFPPGSSATQLAGVLLQQGFSMLAPCETDASIHRALFQQHGGSLSSFPIFATVYWKQNDANVIVWTKGYVAFTGP